MVKIKEQEITFNAWYASLTRCANYSCTSVDATSGETHLRHNVTAEGFYRGKKVINK